MTARAERRLRGHHGVAVDELAEGGRRARGTVADGRAADRGRATSYS